MTRIIIIKATEATDGKTERGDEGLETGNAEPESDGQGEEQTPSRATVEATREESGYERSAKQNDGIGEEHSEEHQPPIERILQPLQPLYSFINR